MTTVNPAATAAGNLAGARDETYVVQRGDSLSDIAQRYGISLQALIAANPQIHNPNLIYPGDRINIPAGGAPAPDAGTPAAPVGGGGGSRPSGMSLSQNGLDMIKGFEGLRLNAYQDSAGVWTIGYGHTGGVRPGDRITQAQAEQYLRGDVKWAEQAVRDNVKVPLTQGQFDALVSFTFNLGAGALQKSTLLKKLNAGDYAGAQAEFGKWVHAGGQRLEGLVRRRAEEAALFGNKPPSGTAPAPAPAPGPAPAPAPAPGPAPAPAPSSAYTVKRGDTLSDIAQRHGVSLQALLAANPQISNPNLIFAGQKINIPSGGGSPQPTTGSYTVQRGDTLSDIAQRHGVSLQSLIGANPQIRNPNEIDPGQKVNIPGGSRPTNPTTPTSPTTPTAPTAPTTPGGGNSGAAPWMNHAEGEKGQREVAGSRANPRIMEYHKSSGYWGRDDSGGTNAWCGSFVNWAIEKAGLQGPKDAFRAREWANWGNGVSLANARYGDVVVIRNGDNYHVGFYAGREGNTIKLLGGNQSDSVNVSNFSASSVYAVRRP
jgi:uncharacterized protein (TIGR02594 family)